MSISSWVQQHCTLTASGSQPFQPYPYQLDLWSDPSRQRIILKSRQVGVSLAVAVEAAFKAYSNPGSTILIVSRSHATARNLLRYCARSLRHAWLNGQLPPPSNRSRTELEWDDLDSRILSLPASEDGARGYSATDIVLDEAAYLPWAEEIYQSLAPTVSAGGTITVISTPHGRGNLFHRLWEEEGVDYHPGQPPTDAWSRHAVHWRSRPEYNREAWYGKERPRHSERAWAEEYELSFESSGANVFLESTLLRLLAPEAPLAIPPFAAGLDLARARDYTALAILDSSGSLIRLLRFNAASWSIQVDRVATALHELNAPVVVTVDTGGPGDAVYEMLLAAASRAVTIQPFQYTEASRTALIERLVLAAEHARFRLPVIENRDNLLAEMRAYQWLSVNNSRMRADHPPGGHDDCIQALALAWHSFHGQQNQPKPRAPHVVYTSATPLAWFRSQPARSLPSA